MDTEKIKPNKWLQQCSKNPVGAKHTEAGGPEAVRAVGKSNMGATVIQRCHFLKTLRPVLTQFDPFGFQCREQLGTGDVFIEVAKMNLVKTPKWSWEEAERESGLWPGEPIQGKSCHTEHSVHTPPSYLQFTPCRPL